jgi:polar amino acid transport system permease protein
VEYVGPIASGIPMSLLLTVLGFAIGVVGGIPLALMRRSRLRSVRFLSRSIIELLRGIPPIVWIFLVYFGIGNGLIKVEPVPAAIVAFGLISCAYLAEIYRGGLAAVHRGQWEAGVALGLSHNDQLARIIGPQVLRFSIPAAATYAIGLLKDTSIAFTIGAQEILFFADSQAKQSSDALTPYLVAAAAYIIITVPCAWFARSVDRRLRVRIAS